LGRLSMINAHMVPFIHEGKKYVKNMETGSVLEVADIELPSMNEMTSYGVEESPAAKKDQDARLGRGGMATKRRGRSVEVSAMHVESKGKNLLLTFRIPAESLREVFPHIERFAGRTRKVKRARLKKTYAKT